MRYTIEERNLLTFLLSLLMVAVMLVALEWYEYSGMKDIIGRARNQRSKRVEDEEMDDEDTLYTDHILIH